MTELLTEDQVRANLRPSYNHIKPLEHTAQGLYDTLVNAENRFMLGLPEIDVLTRGFGKNELALIIGFAHAGKTQLVNTMIYNNMDKRILFFSLDDPAEMIFTKLVCLKENMPAQELETFIRHEPERAGKWLKEVARKYDKLLIPDGNISLDTMREAIDEAADYWGAYPEAVVIDYLTLVPNGNDSSEYSAVKGKSEAVKRWVKGIDAPVILVHQSNRSHGAPGDVQTMLSAAYGGEQEGTFMLGVRRKVFKENLTTRERTIAERTVTVHLMKNKRPPGRLTSREGIDFYINPETGLIRPWHDSDVPPSTAATVAARSDQRLPYKERD